MIDLTPLEVRKKKGDFRRTMRGYEPQAVDDFLDLVADRLEQIVREHMALSERVAAIDSQIADYRDRERALTEALVSAQEMREDMRRQMEREADLKRREAEAEVEVLRTTATQQREREEEQIRRLRARQSQLMQSYRAFLERELAELAVIAETIDASKAMEEAEAAPPRHTKTSEPPAAGPVPMPLPVAPPAAEPVPMPLPIAQPEPEFDFAAAQALGAEPARAPEAEPARTPEAEAARTPEAEAAPALEPEFGYTIAAEADVGAEVASKVELPFDTDFDALLDEVPFAPMEAEPPLPLPDDIDMNMGAPLPDLAEIDLIDEKDDDDDDDESDGWVSTLLEGKGD